MFSVRVRLKVRIRVKIRIRIKVRVYRVNIVATVLQH